MYQLSLSIAKNKSHWLCDTKKLLENIANINGVFVKSIFCDRVYYSFGCELEDSQTLKQYIKQYVIEVYLGQVKKEYIKNSIRIKVDYFDILVSILTSFDSESEEKLLSKLIVFNSHEFSIDGHFYFRLQDLQVRWAEICALTKENAFFFSNKDTLLELIRFLMSTIRPKIEKVVITKGDMPYEVKQGDVVVASFDNIDDLMLYIIDVAPLEINLVGDIVSPEYSNLLSNIFEEKLTNNTITIPHMSDITETDIT